ncbi:ERCC4 domain-containing protein, partial [bacterium]|nr:ERCC4 domain-containing protein [bacterium]
IQDSREQAPLQFSPEVTVRVEALTVGDYSLPGLEYEIVIERKSLSDLLGSITHDRDRFNRELRQMRGFRFAAIVVEASWSDILQGNYRSRTHPNSVIGSLMSFSIKYGVQVVLAENHATAAVLTERMLRLYRERILRDHRALTKAEKAQAEAEIQQEIETEEEAVTA